MILTNGKIYALNGHEFEAIAIAGDKIVAIGSNQEIQDMCSFSAQQIDLQGKTMVPGFNDSHLHMLDHGMMKHQINLEKQTSIAGIIETSRAFIQKNIILNSQWIIGYGWNQNNFMSAAFPVKTQIDAISTAYPIMLNRVCGHIAVANSLALQLTGATPDTRVKGGSFDTDEHGELTGIIRENAIDWMVERMPQPTVNDIKAALKSAMTEALSVGLCSVQTSDLHTCAGFDDMYQAYMELQAKGELHVRFNAQLFLPDKAKLMSFLSRGLRTGVGNDYFRLGPVKLLTDGSLGARTAALNQPYSDDPAANGILLYAQDELNELVDIAHNNDMQLFLHAIGDRAIASSITALGKALTGNPRPHRHRINHFQVGSIELFNKAHALELLADIQPVFVSSDWEMAQSRLGKHRTSQSYAWKTMQDKGISLAGGSDSPVEDFNPLKGICAAVCRKDMSGNPRQGWHSEQNLSVMDALRMFTLGSAYASFDETRKGTLTPGKLADMVVLSEDPFKIPPEEIKNIKILMTFVGGDLRYIKS